MSEFHFFSKIDDFFGQRGKLSGRIELFEYRKEQHEMATIVGKNLEEKTSIILEAGTGTGKSLAYLIPLLIWAREHNLTVCVSTETKALQDQLTKKEIPLLKSLGVDFQAEIAYGNSNYICLRKLNSIAQSGDYNPREESIFKNLAAWVNTTSTGLRQNIPFDLSAGTWSKIMREGDNTLNRKCPFFQKCFYQEARKKWQKANLLILNHYLYFSNIAAGGYLLPEFDIIVFDEAHNLERIVTDQLSFEISFQSLEMIFLRIYDKKKAILLNLLYKEDEMADKISEAKKILDLGRNFFSRIPRPENGRFWRLKEALGFGGEFSREIEKFFLGLKKRLGEKKEGETLFPRELSDEENLFAESTISHLEEWVLLLGRVLKAPDNEMIYWIKEEIRAGQLISQFPAIKAAPISVKELIQKYVLSRYDSSFFISATLSVGGNFQFIRQRLGIPDSVLEKSLPSPFDFEKQVLLYTSSHIGNPGDPDSKYLDHILYISNKLIRITGGFGFILFTSYKTLNLFYDGLLDFIGNENYSVICQDGRPASLCIQDYLSSENPLLLGTSSFWQGVDIPGDNLRLVVLTRIPFEVPDDPVMEARLEELKKRGLNPFAHYSVPLAALRLKQGFGRLIRRKTDRGIIAILDSRLHNKSYGKVLLSAIPKCTHLNNLDEIRRMYKENFLDRDLPENN